MITKYSHLGLRQALMVLMNWADKRFGKTHNWLKLSNSGDSLKLIIPSHSRKVMSGWTNYSGTVTSYKISENEMGYRGSKSTVKSENPKRVTGFINTVVKEQRVDGSYFRLKYYPKLRCTLMGCESNYPFKIPTKQLINRKFSTRVSSNIEINPWFITGFSDAESSFFISIYRDENSKLKWRVTACFAIHIHIKDMELLKSIQRFFGVGKVRKNSKTTAIFRVDNIQELQIIVDHFNNYPLISNKLSDFLLFENCYKLIKQKQHLTQEGLEKIVALRYNLNRGITDELKFEFQNIVPVNRPEYIFQYIPNPFWTSGFVSGDSSFSVTIEKNNSKLGNRVRLIFGTCLQVKDKGLLIGIRNYFNNLDEHKLNQLEGAAELIQVHLKQEVDMNNKYIYESETNQTALLQIKNTRDIFNKIIPFFNKYPILGVKSLDFSDFKKIAELIKNKEHLTEEGLKKIYNITEGMNLNRKL